MALGKRSDEQQEMWVATTSLPKSQGHVFYRKLNQLLAEADFDRTVEEALSSPITTATLAARRFRRASTFACCWSAILRASARNGALPGVVATAFRCGSSSASRSPKRRPTIPA